MVILKSHVTIEEFEAFLALPENADKTFELIAGEIVEKMPVNLVSSHICSRINRRIGNFVESQDLGFVTDSTGGYVINGERYAPDVAYISKEKGVSLEWFNPVPPDLAVEVDYPSSTKSRGDLMIKLVNYLAAGVLVWIVYPEDLEVQVYAPGEKPRVLGINDTLDGGSVLPGLVIPLREIFPPSLLPPANTDIQ